MRDYHSRSPLHDAARHGSLEAVQALIDAGADLEARDEDGSTPLMLADRHQASSIDISEALLDGGAEETRPWKRMLVRDRHGSAKPLVLAEGHENWQELLACAVQNAYLTGLIRDEEGGWTEEDIYDECWFESVEVAE